MRHPCKEIRESIKFATDNGWTLKKADGHAWGVLRCAQNDVNCRGHEFCQISIWSTPRNPETEAKKIARLVKKCIHHRHQGDG